MPMRLYPSGTPMRMGAIQTGMRLISPGGAAPSSLLTDLVAYWTLNETSGTRFDSTANNNNLTDNNSVGSAPGIQGNAASFNGIDQSLIATTTPALQVGTQDFALSMWLKTTNTALSGQVLVSHGLFASPGWWIDQWSQVIRIRFGTTGTTTINAANNAIAVNDGVWHHLVINFNRSGSINAYLDGDVTTPIITADISSSAGESATVTQPFVLAAYSTGMSQYWPGDIDEVAYRIGSTFSNAEIALLYNGGSGITYPFN